MNNQNRLQEIIRAIQTKRNSRLITYVTGDRVGIPAQINEDAVRPMYRHLSEAI